MLTMYPQSVYLVPHSLYELDPLDILWKNRQFNLVQNPTGRNGDSITGN